MIARQSFRWLFLIIELQPQRLSRGNRYVVENIYCNVAFEWKFKWNPGYPYSQIPRYKVPPLTHLPWNKMRITITRWYSFRPEKALVCIVRSGSAHSLYVGWLQAGFLNMLKKMWRKISFEKCFCTCCKLKGCFLYGGPRFDLHVGEISKFLQLLSFI